MTSRAHLTLLAATAAVLLPACGSSTTGTTPSASSSAPAPSAQDTTTESPLPSEASTAAQGDATTASPETSAGAGAAASASTRPDGSLAVDGTGYTLDRPAGYQADVPEGAEGAEAGYQASDGQGVRMFVVEAGPAGVMSVHQAATKAIASQAADGTGMVTMGKDTTLAGAPAVPLYSAGPIAGQQSQVEQLFASHGGKIYRITMISSSAASADALTTQFAPVMDTWRWDA